jgi:hypothetical protein
MENGVMAEVELPNPDEIAEHHKDHFTRRVKRRCDLAHAEQFPVSWK